MDRNRNANDKRPKEVKPIRRKKVTEEDFGKAIEEIAGELEDETIWIKYEPTNPNPALIKPMMKTGLAMVNPKKPNSYHIKKAAALKLCKMLGKEWTIEDNTIVRKLPYELVFEHKFAGAADHQAIRNEFLEVPPLWTRGIKRLVITKERPEQLDANDTLYLIYNNFTEIGNRQIEARNGKYALNNNDGTNTDRFRNQILDAGQKYPIAIYSEQTIWMKVQSENILVQAKLMAEALKGAKDAIKFKSQEQPVAGWLDEVCEDIRASRKDAINLAETGLDTAKLSIKKASQTIRAATQDVDKYTAELERLKERVTKANLLKRYPQLHHIRSVCQDNPDELSAYTNDIIINGQNIGQYIIRMKYQTMRVGIIGKEKPENLVHPNLIINADGSCTWDITDEKGNEIVAAIAGKKVGQAISLIIENLLTLHVDDELHQTRLRKIAEHTKLIKEKANAAPAQATIGTGA